MENALYVALSNQMAMRRHMDVIANNVANASTPGFKGELMLLAEHLTETEDGQQLSFVQDIGTARDLAQGNLSRTGNKYDLAIQGKKGWFVVRTPEGDRYTRNGHFRVDRDNQLVNAQGHPVVAKGGQNIVLGPNDATFVVKGSGAIQTESGQWELQVVEFENPQTLLKVSEGLFQSDTAPVDAQNAVVVQGVIEESNVEPILEITRMIWTLRQYQSTQKFIDTEQELQRAAIQTIAEPV